MDMDAEISALAIARYAQRAISSDFGHGPAFSLGGARGGCRAGCSTEATQ